MDEITESKNALWRREDQLRCWNTSETNSASSEPRDRQLSAVKFHDGCVFLAACSSGDTKEVAWLLGRGADINTANVDGLTALHQVSSVSDAALSEHVVAYLSISRSGSRPHSWWEPHSHTLRHWCLNCRAFGASFCSCLHSHLQNQLPLLCVDVCTC